MTNEGFAASHANHQEFEAMEKTQQTVFLNGSEVKTPISECTAVGGPERCRVHSRMLAAERERDEADVLSAVQSSESIADRVDEIRRKIAANGYSDELLAELDAVDELVEDGRMTPLRMPADAMRRGKAAGLPRWFRSLYHLLAAQSDPKSPQGLFGDRVKIAEQEKTVADYARARGVWDPDLVGTCELRFGRRFAEGGESYCYWDKTDPTAPKTVVKVNATVFNRESVRAMERIMLHNLYFPEAALTVEGVGVMRREGKHAGEYLAFLVRQEGFDFSDVEVADEDRLGFMKAKGFSPRPGSGKTFVSDDAGKTITIGDLNVNNIRLTTDGRILVMDALEALNLPCYRRDGTYDIASPPSRLFAVGNMKEEDANMTENAKKTEDEMPKSDVADGMDDRPRPWEMPPVNNPYYDEALQRSLRKSAQNLTWQSLHDHAILRKDPDAVGCDD